MYQLIVKTKLRNPPYEILADKEIRVTHPKGDEMTKNLMLPIVREGQQVEKHRNFEWHMRTESNCEDGNKKNPVRTENEM